jgi:hypothetical protein
MEFDDHGNIIAKSKRNGDDMEHTVIVDDAGTANRDPGQQSLFEDEEAEKPRKKRKRASSTKKKRPAKRKK